MQILTRKAFLIFCSFCLLVSLPLFSRVKSYALPDSQGVPIDIKLLSLLNYPNGTFIEVGAYDGVTYSNTKLLEEGYGWSGILIEPSTVLFEKLHAVRPNSLCFNCALGSFAEEGSFVRGDFDGHPMASINGIRMARAPTQTVLIRSLQSILDEVGIDRINLFSLDVEGHELEVLQGIDFNKTTFDYLLIEIYDIQKEDILSFLSSKGYDLLYCITNYNHISNPGWDGTHNDYVFIRNGLSIKERTL